MTSPDGTTDTSNDSGSENLEDRDFYNIFDGTKGRTEGVYLDIQERKDAEVLRAAAENREPNLSDPGSLPPAVGTPMVVKEMRVDNSILSNPSINFTGHKDVDPVFTSQVDTGDGGTDVDLSYAAQVARERSAQDEALVGAADQGGEPEASGEVETGPSTEETENADYNTQDYTV